MIIWLASYPKSGNTWVRSMITSLLYSEDGNFDFRLIGKIDQFPEKKYFKDLIKDFNDFQEIYKNWIVAQDKINLDGKVKILKTHQGKFTISNNNFTNNENTLGVIYIVRDPRTLVKSISNHYTLSAEDAFNFLIHPRLMGDGKSFKEKEYGLYNILGKWDEHYRSWTTNKNNLLLIKYEDLIKNTEVELKKIIEFLQKYLTFEFDEKKIKNILKTTSFESLKNMEKLGKFKEQSENKIDGKKVEFFNLGPKNIWQENLKKEIVLKIERNFYSAMKELNYL
tara:strand:+ start:13 stop:855 length:843 start_codon:yes stop_codon:yes gene_type:complete